MIVTGYHDTSPSQVLFLYRNIKWGMELLHHNWFITVLGLLAPSGRNWGAMGVVLDHGMSYIGGTYRN